MKVPLVIIVAILSTRSNASNVEQQDEKFWMTPDAASSSSSSSNVEQFSCTLAAKDASSCEAATADDGSHCVWCSLSGLGFCVSDAQAKAMEKVIPTIKCDNGPTPKTDDAVHPPTVAPTANDPNSDIWDCLDKKDEVTCHKTSATTKCTWCVSKVGYGLCLAPVEADFASTSKWFKCDKGDDTNVAEDAVAMAEEPVTDFDTSCLVASLEQDASFCQATKDGQNENCKWCHLSSAPTLQMCLSSEQADLAGAFVSCDQQVENSVITTHEVQDPLDMSCVEASMIQDETVCESTVDVSGQACEWCAIPRVPYHVCLSKDQVNLVSGFVECSKPPSATAAVSAAVSTSNKKLKQKKHTTKLLRSGSNNKKTVEKYDKKVQDFDASCLMASLAQDASICQATNDATGQVCEWCHATTAPSLHLCLSSEQATLATGLVSCDTTDLDVEMESPVVDPSDLTCLEASLMQDESACESTSDTSGQACEYCSIPNLPFHVCLSEEQASMVAGFVTCSTGPSSAPATALSQTAVMMTTTTTTEEEKVDFPPNLFKCLHLLDEGGCAKGACTWCDTQIGFGLCLPKEAAAATDNCPFFDCDGPTNTTTTNAAEMTKQVAEQEEPETTFAAPDINCLAAGMGSDDAQSVCQATMDQQGSACVWCDAAGSGFGLCLSQEEAKVAGKWLQCSSSDSNEFTTAIKN